MRRTVSDGRLVENIQPEVACDLLACGNAAHAVALVVEARRKHADTEAPRQYCQNAAADATFSGHADFVQPAAGVIVHAAGGHH
jgi:hypothetical protein